MYNTLFPKFPGLRNEMLAESFAHYIREFRKPCGNRRAEMISRLNKKKHYSTINLSHDQGQPRR